MSDFESKAVRVTRRFSAVAERVFDAWLDAEKASRWLFATPDGVMVRAEIDARVGGAFAFVERRAGEDVEHVGEYLEIDRPRRLAFTLRVPKYSAATSKVIIEIVPQGEGCELTLTHEQVPEDFREQTASGWESILDALAASLG